MRQPVARPGRAGQNGVSGRSLHRVLFGGRSQACKKSFEELPAVLGIAADTRSVSRLPTSSWTTVEIAADSGSMEVNLT